MVLRTKGFDEKSNLGRLFIGFSHISNLNIQLYLEGMQLATRDALPGSLRIIVRLPSDGGPPACCQPGPRLRAFVGWRAQVEDTIGKKSDSIVP
ncbi:MAG: hypothetical protein NTW84_00390 [Methanothrix sp.]|nr:hypothetical protein [Methanothrix sp.]